jgi:WD40 repeat protein
MKRIELIKLEGHSGKVVCVSVQCDIVVSGSYDRTVRIWNWKHYPQVKPIILSGHMDIIRSIAIQDEFLTLATDISPPFAERIPSIVCDFQYNNSSQGRNHGGQTEDRHDIACILQKSGIASFTQKRMPRYELWIHKINYQFSASPHGVGLDCHRTWEDLILGCIVIVKTSPLDCLYEGLPVVIVNDWHEVTPKNLKIWAALHKDLIKSGSYKNRLTHDYWMQKIKALQHHYLYRN